MVDSSVRFEKTCSYEVEPTVERLTGLSEWWTLKVNSGSRVEAKLNVGSEPKCGN